jgi:hypothetical protein
MTTFIQVKAERSKNLVNPLDYYFDQIDRASKEHKAWLAELRQLQAEEETRTIARNLEREREWERERQVCGDTSFVLVGRAICLTVSKRTYFYRARC